MDKIYFQDESKYRGSAKELFVPDTIDELVACVREKNRQTERITIQGALTGIVGSGVPSKGLAVKTEKLNKATIRLENNVWYAYAETGVTGGQLEELAVKETGNAFFFPALPTEKAATLGGIAASKAKGIHAHYYGEFKDYIEECSVCTPRGEILKITRHMPEFEELFGSEGMLAIFLTFKIRLVEKPQQTWAILFQFANDAMAARFAEQIEERQNITTIEYMDRNTINIIETYKKHMNTIASLPDIEEHIQAVIYVEVIGSSEEEVEEEAGQLLEVCVEAGGDPEDAWAMCTEEDVERLRAYRHAASECVNMEIGKINGIYPEVCKLSLDMRQNLIDRKKLLEEYRYCFDESGIPYCIFGHFGEGGPYVNLIARDASEYEKGIQLLEKWVQKAYERNEQVFGEHGVGKLKREMFVRNAPETFIKMAVQRKKKWDVQGMLNPENMI